MLDAKNARPFWALLFATASLTLSSPAAACEADEEPCGDYCMPAGKVCCDDPAYALGYCDEGYVCYHAHCGLAGGTTKADEIEEADGAPYGPSVERSCAMGHDDPRGGGFLVAAVALAFGLAGKARARRSRSR